MEALCSSETLDFLGTEWRYKPWGHVVYGKAQTFFTQGPDTFQFAHPKLPPAQVQRKPLCVCVLYLEYAEQQDDAEHHHEQLRANGREVGYLHSWNKNTPSQVQPNTPTLH